ncbi:MAG: pacearchaeosortase [Nanoarchaeota archaeon]
MKNRGVLDLSLRYIILLILGIFSTILFYFIFTPLTVYPVFWILHLIEGSTKLLPGNLIFVKGFYAEIISACVAGAAYYLLLILNLSTPMRSKKRIFSLLFLIFSFLLLNISRILLFIYLLVSGYQYFELTHKLTWYFGSTILVVLLWFLNVFLFNIKNIPIYTDMKNLFSDVKKV